MTLSSRLRKVARPSFWRQVPWRIRALADRSGIAESRVAVDVHWFRRAPREPYLYSRDGLRPLRILLVAMQFDYGSFRRGLSYEQTHFVGTLADWGYELVQFDFVHIARRHGRKAMNRMLRECAVRTRPDLAFFVLFRDEIDPATVEYVRAHGIVTLNWFCDDQWRYESFSRHWAPFFDYVATTSGEALLKYRRDGHRNVLKTQWGFNPYLFRCHRSSLEKDIEIVFVGQPHGERRRMVQLLRRQGFDVRAFGYGWPGGRVLYSEMIDLYQRSRIVLGLSTAWDGRTAQVKGRDFEVPAAGAFYLTAHHPEIAEFFTPGEEIACYATADELVELCTKYLQRPDDRERVTGAGRARAWREHSYVHRFSQLFDAMGFRRLERW